MNAETVDYDFVIAQKTPFSPSWVERRFRWIVQDVTLNGAPVTNLGFDDYYYFKGGARRAANRAVKRHANKRAISSGLADDNTKTSYTKRVKIRGH